MVAKGLDPLWAAQSLLRRRKYDECIDVCSQLLKVNPYDQACQVHAICTLSAVRQVVSTKYHLLIFSICGAFIQPLFPLLA